MTFFLGVTKYCGNCGKRFHGQGQLCDECWKESSSTYRSEERIRIKKADSYCYLCGNFLGTKEKCPYCAPY